MEQSGRPGNVLWHGAIQAAHYLPWWGYAVVITGFVAEMAHLGKKRRRRYL
jgi:hypothetical protein